ncbi:MAG: head-tail adaptor protein [Peptostreptococcaceae bacterium]
MKIVKFDNYNDGVLVFGNIDILKDENLNELKKEFISKGKLFLSFKNLRFEDREKYDTEFSCVDLKVQTLLNKNIQSNSIVKINGILYEVVAVEPNLIKNRMYIYLKNYFDKFNNLITFEKRELINNMGFEECTYKHFLDVFSKIDDMDSKENMKNGSLIYRKAKKIKVYYNDKLDLLDLNREFRVIIDDKCYNILSIKNQNDVFLIMEVELWV